MLVDIRYAICCSSYSRLRVSSTTDSPIFPLALPRQSRGKRVILLYFQRFRFHFRLLL